MHVFEMVIWIVAITSIATLIRQKMKNDQSYSDKSDLDSGALDRISQLENRIKVLERIVTDKSHRLSSEIDSL